MNTQLIDGKALAARLIDEIKQEVNSLKLIEKPSPTLAVIMVGEDPASAVYVRNKIRQCGYTGIRSIERLLPESCSQAQLLAVIDELNHDPQIDGILLQLPLPRHISADLCLRAIAFEKDVDGFHPYNMGLLLSGDPNALVPCTPQGCILLLQQLNISLTGKHLVMLGRSNIVGKPALLLALQHHCTVTVVHSKSANLAELCRQADILIVAVGQPEMVQASWVKSGAVVIDVGINRVVRDGVPLLVGDVDFAEVAPKASAITPVPGGVGPMTIACLLRNTLQAYRCRRG
ncbi:MAG: bifunctional methylenetetrahydrofolate dehydrogenase/methenyltetrahydrofolate cyclohydrolase FolD [Ferrimonas sp.]